MYLILVYDINIVRINKIFKLVKQYLNRIQNSVFEGNLSEKNYNELIRKLDLIVDEEEDTIIIFKFNSDKVFKRIELGRKNPKPSLFIDEDSF